MCYRLVIELRLETHQDIICKLSLHRLYFPLYDVATHPKLFVLFFTALTITAVKIAAQLHWCRQKFKHDPSVSIAAVMENASYRIGINTFRIWNVGVSKLRGLLHGDKDRPGWLDWLCSSNRDIHSQPVAERHAEQKGCMIWNKMSRFICILALFIPFSKVNLFLCETVVSHLPWK